MIRGKLWLAALLFGFLLFLTRADVNAWAWDALPIADDLLLRMPETQPGWDGVSAQASFTIK